MAGQTENKKSSGMKGLVIIGCFLPVTAVAQDANVSVQKGNELYRQGRYDAAAAEYQAALKIKQDPATKFNLASALSKQGKNEEAKKVFKEIAASDAKDELKAKAYYNEGAILSKEKKLEESIEAYKNAFASRSR
jgi:Ca-activated chloride channel family protein